MQRFHFTARLAALATAVAIIISCDSRLPTQGGGSGTGTGGGGASGDVELPVVDVALSSGPKDSVLYLGSTLGVAIAASDNKGVASLTTSLRNAGALTVVDTANYTSPPPTVSRSFTIASNTVRRGDRVVIKTTALDAASNTRVDSVIAVVADTAPPALTVTSTTSGNKPTAGATVVGGDSMYVHVVATDSAGIDSAGYRLLYVRSATDTVQVSTLSTRPATRTNSQRVDAAFIISDTLPIGSYVIQGLGSDLSGLAARRNVVVTFTLTDGQKPAITLVNPASTGRIAVGDSLFVKARVSDNAGVRTVGFVAVSFRGDSSLGTAFQKIRYDSITANVSGRADSAMRMMAVSVPVDTLTDSVVVRATVTDQSGNFNTVSRKIQVVPTLSIVANTAGRTFKSRDTMTVRVTAGDTTGVVAYGYKLYRIRTTDSVLVSGDSLMPAANTYVASNPFLLTLLDTLTPGTYTLKAFSRVASAVARRTAAGATFSVGDGIAPTISFTTPIEPGYRQTVGGPLPVTAKLHDNASLARASFRGYSVRMRADLSGTDTVVRYQSITVPTSGQFHGYRDTTVTVNLQPVTSPKLDSLTDTLYVEGVVADSTGLTSRTIVRALMTNGPKVTIISPVVGDSINRGGTFIFTVNASSDFGVASMSAHIVSDASWPTKIDTIVALPFAGPSNNVTVTGRIPLPADAVPLTPLTLTPTAVDVLSQTGSSAPFQIYVRGGLPPAPLVKQVVAPRLEISDSIQITATGDRISAVGYQLRNRANVTVATYSTLPTTIPQKLPLNLPSSFQGQRYAVVTFARDSAGRTGWSVPSSVSTVQTDSASAWADSTDIVYGQTFSMPAGRPGIAGDVVVDAASGNVFISNTKYNRLEKWNAAAAKANPATAFDPTGVSVGSEPWGMVLQADNDTLLVANSGGTNISKVCISSCPTPREVASKRLQTRNTYIFTVTETRDAATGRIQLSATGPISYSDRPQYVQQSAGGRLYYSTKPTTFAPKGTIRWLDPTLKVPDPRQVYQYAATTANAGTYVIFNADSIAITRFQGIAPPSDRLTIFDHVYGDTLNKPGMTCNGSVYVICATDSVVVNAIAKVDTAGGIPTGADVVGRNDVSVEALGLTDTTFVSASGDRSWIGFGEGNTNGGTGRVMMVNDPAGTPEPGFFSPAVTVRDLLENASESVYGLGIDLHGANVAVHGAQSYFASLENPFHLRLQGKFDTFDRGAGITYHPSADLRNGFVSSSPSDSTRTAFVASSNGSIEIVDAFNYVSRGTLQIKGTLYGPLRATLPLPSDNVGVLPSDPSYIVLKLYGLTSSGLVVIDLRASDIKPVP